MKVLSGCISGGLAKSGTCSLCKHKHLSNHTKSGKTLINFGINFGSISTFVWPKQPTTLVFCTELVKHVEKPRNALYCMLMTIWNILCLGQTFPKLDDETQINTHFKTNQTWIHVKNQPPKPLPRLMRYFALTWLKNTRELLAHYKGVSV